MTHKLLLLFIFFTTIVQTTHATTIYVNANVQGGNQDGTSWENAFPSLQSALVASVYGDTIWVAQGVYRPTTGSSRTISFTLKNGIKLYGGFLSTENSLSERDWVANVTTLSGDIGVPGDSTDNSYNVLYCNEADSTTVLDGFTITGGNANLSTAPFNSRPRNGGGMYLSGSSLTADTRPTIANCTFADNHAQASGGGLFIRTVLGAGATPLLINCIFENNSAKNGGGMYKEGGSTLFETIVERCIFQNNKGESGAGICFQNDGGNKDMFVSDCRFYGNSSVFLGGGVYHEVLNEDAKLRIEGCTFQQNLAIGNAEGSAIANYNLEYSEGLTIDKCSFIENLSEAVGTISLLDGHVDISNSVFVGNKAIGGGNTSGGCFSIQGTFLKAVNCIFEKSYAYKGSVVYFSSESKVEFLNCTVASNKGTENSFSPPSNSSTFSSDNSVFWDNTVLSGDKLFNVLGVNLTISHCIVNVSECNDLGYGNPVCGPGMIYLQDPLFLDTAANDLRLHSCSPARNAGSNTIVDSLGIATDIAGLPRILEGTVDMGAHETPAYAALLDSALHAACHGLPNGGLLIEVASGCPPFTVDLGGASTVSAGTPIVLQSLPAGTYNLTIIDAQGRTDTVQATIGQPSPLMAQALATDVSCENGTPGSATAQASGGTPGYSFSWSGGQSGPLADNLLPGPYALSITDSHGCVAIDSFFIQTVGGLELETVATDVTCFGFGDGSASATPVNGTAPFAWLWQGGLTDSTLTGLTGGSYAATVTDALGCTGTVSVEVAASDSLVLQIDAPTLVCFETNDAEAVATATGGTWPYAFEWASGEMDSVLSGIGAGSHALTLTDANGCVEEQSVEIEETTAVQIQDTVLNASSSTAADGAVLVTQVLGGLPPYSFLWGNGDTTQSLENVPPGGYSLTVMDSLGCEFVFDFMVDFESAVLGGNRGNFSAAIVPNPSLGTSGASLWIESAQALRFDVSLCDALGRVLYNGQQTGSGSHTLPSGLAPGVYWVIAHNKTGERMGLRMVVL